MDWKQGLHPDVQISRYHKHLTLSGVSFCSMELTYTLMNASAFSCLHANPLSAPYGKGRASQKVVILLICDCQWSGRDRAKVPAHSFPHSCTIPLCLCATDYAQENKFRGVPCPMTWMHSNISSLWEVTAVLSRLLHNNGFQIAPINNVLYSCSCRSSHCTNISCIDRNWHNHSSQTTTVNLSVLLGSAIGKHKSRAFGANFF